MENEIVHMPEQIQELTLLLMYLTSWQERRTIGLRRKPHKTDDMLLRRCWKGYDFSVLERLEAQGLICGEEGFDGGIFSVDTRQKPSQTIRLRRSACRETRLHITQQPGFSTSCEES